MRPFLTPVTALLLGLSVTACSPVVATRGNLADPERVAEIKQGSSRMEDVAAILGSPTAVGTFDQTVWYYIGQRTEKTAFFDPEVVERRVVVVRFDPAGTVAELKVLTEADGQEIEIVDRATPTAGREMTVLEQLLGNIGRVGAPAGRSPINPNTGTRLP